MAEDRPLIVNVDVDASELRRELGEAERLSRRFGSALGDALEAGVARGASLSEVLKGLGARLSSLALGAALKPVENALGQIFSGLTKTLFAGVSPFGQGGLAAPAGVQSALASASGAAAAGPALQASGAPGDLRAAAAHGPVTVNIATPDAESFRRSEAQVSAALARAVARGRRGL